MKLFCLPHAGGSASVFTPLETILTRYGIDCVSIEYPGHGARMAEPLCKNIKDLVSDVTKQLPTSEEDYCLYGHSLGGHIAFEVAQSLRRNKSNSLRHLFLSGSAGPSVPVKLKGLHDLPSDIFYERLSSLGGVHNPERWDEDIKEIFLPILRADFEIVSSIEFQNESPLDIPITAFAGTEDIYSCDEIQQWQRETVFPLSMYQFEGDHFFPFSSLNKLAKLLVDKMMHTTETN